MIQATSEPPTNDLFSHPFRQRSPSGLRIQGFGGNIQVVSPRKHSQLFVDVEVAEESHIAEASEYSATRCVPGQVDDSPFAIVKDNLNSATTPVLR